MTCSPEKLAANRANALKSSGPRTDEGKAISRTNSLKHGLTGHGVVLPGEDAAAIDRRFESYVSELNPRGEHGRDLARRAAFLMTRLDRFARHETAVLTTRMLKATDDFDEARLTEVDLFNDSATTETYTNARRLTQTPEGIDKMLDAFWEVKTDLEHTQHELWDYGHFQRIENLTGRKIDEYPLSRVHALSDAIFGKRHFLDPGEAEGLEGKALVKWAKEQMIALIDDMVGRLKAKREALDHEAIRIEREGAMSRALVDPSPEMVLARKYEQATVRELKQTLDAIRRQQGEPQVVAATPSSPTISDPVGSLLSEDEEESITPPPRQKFPTGKALRRLKKARKEAQHFSKPTIDIPGV